MASEWRKVRIGDIAGIIGGSTPSTREPENFGGDIPWITPKDLSGYHYRFVSDGERNITQTGLARCSARLLPKNAVLLSTRAPIGYVAIAANPLTTNQGFRSLVLKPGYDPEFVYYLLGANTEYLQAHGSGTTYGELTGSALKRLEFAVPPLYVQRHIAHILGALDDKIELNRRMNRTLEKMAAAIFKSWFIDFDPVRAKAEGRETGLPKDIAELFPDGFEEAELGEIPRGWQPGALGDIADNPRRSIKPDAVPPTTPYIGLQHMPRRCIALDTWGRAGDVGSQKSRFKEGEILFGKLRPYFHKVGIAPVDGVCSTDILVAVPKSTEWHGYVLSLVSSKAFVDYTDAHSAGTKMPRTNWKDMSRYPSVLPPVELARAFQDHVAALHRSIGVSVRQNRRLTHLRDTLLPKLLSGEIELPAAEAIAEEVV